MNTEKENHPPVFCCTSLALAKVYEDKAYFITLLTMKLTKEVRFSTNLGLSTNTSGYSLDLSIYVNYSIVVFHRAHVRILTS